MNRKDLVWWLIDPILIKINSRLEHLRATRPQANLHSKFNNSARYGSTVKFLDGAIISNYGNLNNLEIGDYTHIAGELGIISPTGKLRMGKYCFLGAGSRVWAQTSVTIGDYVLIAHGVDIHDTNAHSTNASTRRHDPINIFEKSQPIDWGKVESKPVVIEDDAWIGFKSSILKGVTIGRGAIVAAGSVVMKDVPPYNVVAGNPAIVVRQLERDG